MPMTKPSIAELLDQADCRYTLVVKVSKRARELVAGAEPLVDARGEDKAVSVAVEEINRGLIEHESLREPGE